MQQLSFLSKKLWQKLHYANSIHYMENCIYIQKQVRSYKFLKYLPLFKVLHNQVEITVLFTIINQL